MKFDPNSPISETRAPLPLAGQTVLITRPVGQAQAMAKELAALGAEILLQPAIEIRPPSDWADVDSAIGRLKEFTWIVFLSVNGVEFFFDRCQEIGVHFAEDSKNANGSHLSIAAGGKKTANALMARGVKVDLVPQTFDSGAMAAALLEITRQARANLETNKTNMLCVRANRGSLVISQSLQDANVPFQEIAVYENADVTAANPDIIRRMQAGEIDWVTVTSSAIARSIVNLFGDALKKTNCVSISPTTSAVLFELGYPPVAEASVFNIPGVVQAMLP